jgi:hypothetical protein
MVAKAGAFGSHGYSVAALTEFAGSTELLHCSRELTKANTAPMSLQNSHPALQLNQIRCVAMCSQDLWWPSRPCASPLQPRLPPKLCRRPHQSWHNLFEMHSIFLSTLSLSQCNRSHFSCFQSLHYLLFCCFCNAAKSCSGLPNSALAPYSQGFPQGCAGALINPGTTFCNALYTPIDTLLSQCNGRHFSCFQSLYSISCFATL